MKTANHQKSNVAKLKSRRRFCCSIILAGIDATPRGIADRHHHQPALTRNNINQATRAQASVLRRLLSNCAAREASDSYGKREGSREATESRS